MWLHSQKLLCTPTRGTQGEVLCVEPTYVLPLRPSRRDRVQCRARRTPPCVGPLCSGPRAHWLSVTDETERTLRFHLWSYLRVCSCLRPSLRLWYTCHGCLLLTLTLIICSTIVPLPPATQRPSLAVATCARHKGSIASFTTVVSKCSCPNTCLIDGRISHPHDIITPWVLVLAANRLW